jgi:hypothetical protein
LVIICGELFCHIALAADDATKPKVAVFPLSGTASADQRDKVGFSLRTKLDRDGHFEPIDGPTMADLTGDTVVDLSTSPGTLVNLAKDESPVILIWGELNAVGSGFDLKIKTDDLRHADSKPVTIEKSIRQPTDLRFAIEHILQNINGVGSFSHPVEDAVKDDPLSLQLWKQNPNLVPDGTFTKQGDWTALLRSEKYSPPISTDLPAADQVVIHPLSPGHNVLAMKLSKDVAESNGLACLSSPIPIEPATRYRLQFKYKSDGPTLHVFVKGYIKAKDISGQVSDLQSYECQVPPSGQTRGQWATVICDVNPQNVSGAPKFLKIDLYAYLSPGLVLFDDIQLKHVGSQTRHAIDDAIKPPAPPTTQP